MHFINIFEDSTKYMSENRNKIFPENKSTVAFVLSTACATDVTTPSGKIFPSCASEKVNLFHYSA